MSPGDMRRLVVTKTPVKYHQLTLIWKTSMERNTDARQYNSKHIKWHQPKTTIRNEQPTIENSCATVLSNPTETLSQEQQTNLENLKRIMNCVKTTLPSLRNIDWRTLKTETNRINQMLPYISTNNISELNDQIYAGAKLVCEKIGVPSKSTKKQSKQGWEIRLETQIKNLRKQAKMVKQKTLEYVGREWKRQEKK